MFVYGTLTDEEFLHRLTKRPLGHFKIVDAQLLEYRKLSPVTIIKSDSNSSVNGKLILNLEKTDLKILDDYECCNPENAHSDENNWYNRKMVNVLTKDKNLVQTFVYISNFSK